MATKKSTPAKKIAPAKKQSKPAAKPAAKPEKKAVSTKKATVKSAPVKAAPKKELAKATSKKVVEAKKPVAKQVAKKATPEKKVAVKQKPAVKAVVKTVPKKEVVVKKAAEKVAPEKAVAPKKAEAKSSAKASPKKEQQSKPLVVPKLSTRSSVRYKPESTSILDTPKQEKVKAVIRYSDAELQEFKEIILRKLDAAKKELVYLQGLITRRDEGGDMDEGRYMTMEDGSLSMEREQLSQMASRQISFIDKLEKALMRVENKSYGICRVTGNLIDKARLRAVPHATLSMEAKSNMNK